MDELIEKINKLQNPSVIGLDSSIDFIPPKIKQAAEQKFANPAKAAANAILEFNKQIIDEIFDIVPAIKLQSAFYELFGFEGIWALCETLIYGKQRGLFTIVDGKKNDIGSSMQAYANAYLGKSKFLNEQNLFSAFDCNALTINPYLGSDSITPIMDCCKTFKKAAFVLIKTSNKSSDELQNLVLLNGKFLFEQVAELCLKFSNHQSSKFNFSSLGAVVGATFPNELKLLRNKLPNTFFLVPGFGAQGGDVSNIKFAFKNGTGAIVNSSRAILGAWINKNCKQLNFAKEARKAALKMKNELLSVI